LVTYRQTRNQRIREQKRKVAIKRRSKIIGAAVAGTVATALLLGVAQKKADACGAVYTVKKGDTLYSLAKNFDTSVEKLQEVNMLASNVIKAGQELDVPHVSGESEAGIYFVQKGDTLFSLAKKYGVTVKDLMKENKLTKETILVGQALTVPTHFYGIEEGIYTVNPGDTLWNIAKRFDVSMEELKEVNHLSKNMVLIGQQLIIPGEIEFMDAIVTGAADNFTVEFEADGEAIPLNVAYGTARDYQELAGQHLVISYKNGALINKH
jgi:LysM repeat protein